MGDLLLNIKKIWNQEAFQGSNRKKNYFEGWYFKLIDKQRKTALAVIPGISIGENLGDSHAFIQVIDAIKGNTEYYRFACGDFEADKTKFDIRIGQNHFSENKIKLDLTSGINKVKGELEFQNIVKYPKSFLSPGIMGPFSFIPCMECYHSVINIQHTINGFLDINGLPTDMSGGEGYIEKDWGRSFPDSWIWLQANHFENQDASFMFSVARIPWLGRSFTGMISFFRTEKGFYKFSTYNGSKTDHIKLDGDTLEVSITNAKYIVDFKTKYAKGGILKAPKNGLMNREIEESITAEIKLKIADHQGNIIFKGRSELVGMEISGNLDDIL